MAVTVAVKTRLVAVELPSATEVGLSVTAVVVAPVTVRGHALLVEPK
jgi:hypothetical protein